MKNEPIMINGEERWLSRSVAAVAYVFTVVDDKICVLVNKRGNGLPNNVGKWNAPSGYLDYDETIEQCAAREVFEETGIKIDTEKLRCFEIDTRPERRNQTVLFRFWCPYYGNPNEITNENSEPNEVDEIKWVPIENIDNCGYEWVSIEHIAALKQALELYIYQGGWLEK